MIKVFNLKFNNIIPVITANCTLLFCIVLLFSHLVVTYFSFFLKNVFVYALQSKPISTSSISTNDQSQSSIQITAGKIQNLSFRLDLRNPDTELITLPESLTEIAVSITSQSNSVKIIGPTSWSIPRLDANGSQMISTKVYASTSTIGNPVFFTVNVQYIKNGQELKTNSFDIGAIIVGDIKIEANNLAVRYLGNTPNLVGNLLNKGNAPALFTNLQVLSVDPKIGDREQQIGNKISQESSQFIGTLTANTPTPFSIPISIDSFTANSSETHVNQSSNKYQIDITNKSNVNKVYDNSSTIIPNNTYNATGTNHVASDIQTKTNPTVFPTAYSISLKISYNDELRNSHELIVNNSIPFGLTNDNPGSTELSNYSYNGNYSTKQNDRAQLESILNNGFVDAYWAEGIPSSRSNNNVNLSSESSSSGTTLTTTTTGTTQTQREVGPGEGPAILAVVLTNTAFSDITGITGYLTLPSGFRSLIPLSAPNSSFPIVYPQDSSTNLHNSSTNIFNGNYEVNQNLPVIASISDVVKAGQTYTLYFKVNILKTATVGSHDALLRTYYFKTPDPEVGAYRVQSIGVPFVLPGKVILDVSSSSTDLIPGEVNHVKIQIRNKGTADANNVVVNLGNVGGSIITSIGDANDNDNKSILTNTIKNKNLTIPPSTPYSNETDSIQQEASSLGSRVFDLGTISANSGAEIDATILPSFSAGESLQNLDLQLSYSDATGETKSSTEAVGFRVMPNPPEAGLAVNPNVPEDLSNLNTSTENSGTNESPGINLNNSTNSDSGLSVTPSRLTNGLITNNDPHNRIILASLENHDNVNNSNKNKLNEGNMTKSKLTSIQSPTLVESNPSLFKNVATLDKPEGIENDTRNLQNNNNNRSDNSITITAAKESDLNFTVTNNNMHPILDAVVSLASKSGSISISGPSKWSLQRLDPGAHQFYPTTVFASKSMIGNPATFDVGVQYIMNGRARNDTFNIGAKVIGEIKIDVTDLGINYIAGTPNLVGNLLNKGNTVALFTTIQLLKNSNLTNQHQSQQNNNFAQASSNLRNGNAQSSVSESVPRSFSGRSVDLVPTSTLPSYLGDLQDDSPLPFSIPLSLKNNSSPGKYPVLLKITYNDDLRNNHEIIFNSTVDLSRSRQRPGSNENQDQGFLGLLLGKQYSLKIVTVSLPIILIIIIATICLLTLMVIRKRSGVVKKYSSSGSSKSEKFFLDEKNKDGLGAGSTYKGIENDRVTDLRTKDNNNISKSSDLTALGKDMDDDKETK